MTSVKLNWQALYCARMPQWSSPNMSYKGPWKWNVQRFSS